MSDPLERLRNDLPLLREGVEVAVDTLLARKLGELVDVAVLTDTLTTGLHEAELSRIVERHLLPARARVGGVLGDATVGSMLTEEVAAHLEEQVASMNVPNFSWLAGAIDPEILRKLFAPIWQDVLMQYTRRLPLGSGIAGALSKMGEFGKGLRNVALRGREPEPEPEQDETAERESIARDFAQDVTSEVRDAIVARLASEEGRELAEQARRQVHQRIMETPARTILDDLERLPLDTLFRMAPPTVDFNAGSELGRAMMRSEVQAVLEVEGERTLAEVLDGAGVLPPLRAYLRVQAEGLLGAMLDEPKFADWISKWLSPPDA